MDSGTVSTRSLLPDGPIRRLLPAGIPPLRAPITAYMDYKSNRVTPATQRGYRSALRAFENHYPGLDLRAFEPPHGTILVEDFLTARWAKRSGRTYNKGLSVLHGFFEWHVRRDNLAADPTENIDEAREDEFQRKTFSEEECARILHANHGAREQVALRLLLFYGIRKGALRGIRLRDFDEHILDLTIFTKGQKYQQVGIPAADPIWDLVDSLGEPGDHYLIPRQQQRRRRPPHRKQMIAAAWNLAALEQLVASIDDPQCAYEIRDALIALDDARLALERAVDSASVQVRRFLGEEISDHAAHSLWYRWLARAGVVDKGTTSGRRMHDSRHTSAQRVLDKTGSMRTVQELLGHANMAVTEHYVGHREGQQRVAMHDVLGLDGDLRRRVRPSSPRTRA